jgi:hypothetical protein
MYDAPRHSLVTYIRKDRLGGWGEQQTFVMAQNELPRKAIRGSSANRNSRKFAEASSEVHRRFIASCILCLFNSDEEMERAMTESREHNEQPKPQEAKPRTDDNQANEKDGAPPAQSTPWAFYVVIGAFLCVTVVFWSCGSFLPPKYSPKAAKSLPF